MKKLIIFTLMFLFLFSYVSAVRVDYSPNDKGVKDMKAIVKDTILWDLIAVGEQGTMELKSHNTIYEKREVEINTLTEEVNPAGIGLIYETNFGNEHKDALTNVKIIDMRAGKEIERDWRFVYSSDGQWEIPIYKEVCSKEEQLKEEYERNCDWVFDYYKYEPRKVWNVYDNNNIPKGKFELGIEIEVKEGDYLDIVLEVQGKGINKHAQVIEGIAEYIYAGGLGNKSVVKYDKDFNIVAVSPSYGGNILSLSLDDDYVYYGGATTNKVRKAYKTNLTTITDSPDYGGAIWSITLDDDYVYCGGAGPTTVRKSYKTNLTTITDSPSYGGGIRSIFLDDDYVYYGGTDTYKVRKAYKTNLTTITDSPSYGDIFSISLDDDYVYYGGATTNKVRKAYKTNLTTITDSPSYGDIFSISLDDDYVYYGGATQTVRKAYKTNLTTITDSPNYGGGIRSIFLDDDYVYHGGDTGTVRKAYKTNLTTITNSPSYGGGIYSISLEALSGLEISLTSPIDYYKSSSSTIDFSANLTDEGGLGIQNVSLVINDTIYDTNTSGLTGIYNFSETLSDGFYEWYVEAYDDTDEYYTSETRYFNISDTIDPTVSNIIWVTTGGFTDNTLIFNQIIDYVNATCSDNNNLVSCNITIRDPDNTIVVNNQEMVGTDNYTYTTDLTLNKAGTWNINITATDSSGNTASNSENINVSIQTQSIKDGWYGYSEKKILNQSEITTLSAYDYDVFELEDNMTTLQSDFSTLLDSINNSREANIKSGLNIILNFDYNSSVLKTQYLTDISEEFNVLNNVPYTDSVAYISLELENLDDYNSSKKEEILNDFAEQIITSTDNEFIVYSKNYNSSGLDSSYISFTDLLYSSASTESEFIQDQKVFFKNNISLNRIYTSLPNNIKMLAKEFHEETIDSLRSIPNPTALLEDDASSLNNNDILIFNNGSSSANYTIDVSGLGVTGKDVWDSSRGLYIEENTDGTITVEVLGYNVSVLYFEDLDHIKLDNLNKGILYKGGSSSMAYSNHTDGVLDGNFGMAGAYDIQIELFDKHYTQANFITYYGWLNVSTISSPKGWENYDVVILADKNNAELDALNYSVTEFYGYISVADYNNTDTWNDAKNNEVDEWLALNDSLNLFIDGMDTGVGGENFTSRMKDLVDYAQITKNRKAILNTYTAYEDFATWGKGGVMKESCVNRWNGISASSPDNYTREDWALELERSSWFSSHNVNVYCQSFGNRTTDGTNTIVDYDDLQNIYFASKVLGYDYFYLSQPDFQRAHEEWVYDVGVSLDRDANQLTTDPNTYYRTYENGIVYYNTTSGEGWIDDGLVVNNMQTCFYLYNPYIAPAEWRFNINNRSETGSIGEYTIFQDWAVGTWEWKCVDTTNETPTNGRYLVEAWVGDHTTIVGQGFNLGWSDYTDSGIHSWYDTSTTDSFTAYQKDRNWMINVSTNISKKTSIDTTNNILQTLVDSEGNKNLTISSDNPFPIEIWSFPVAVTNFKNVSFVNSTGSLITLNYENNSNCDSDNPIWGETNIDGSIYKACIKENDSETIVRIATPSLTTEEVFKIESNNAPVLTSNTTKPDILYTDTDYLINITATDTEQTYLDVYTRFYINDIVTGSLQYYNLTNNTNEQIAILKEGNFSKDDVLITEIILSDGFVNNTAINLTSKTVQNTIPIIGQPTINNTTPYTDEILLCNEGSFSDLDSDSPTWYYKWYNNNNLITGQNSNTLDLSLTGLDKDDIIICSTIASDGDDNATTWTNSSNSATIQNTIPTNPTGSSLNLGDVKVGESLIATGSGSTDADGDTITYYYEFYNTNDTTLLQDYSSDNTYLIKTSDAHDLIRVRVLATTSDANSTGYEELTKLISDTAPTNPTDLTINTTIYVNQELYGLCSDSTDADGDTITYYYEFYNTNDTTLLQDYSSDNTYLTKSTDLWDTLRIRCIATTDYANSTGYDEEEVIVTKISINLEILSPLNNSETREKDIYFRFNHTSESELEYCSFNVTDSSNNLEISNTNINLSNQTTGFYFLDEDTYNINIYCNNTIGDYSNEISTFTILTAETINTGGSGSTSPSYTISPTTNEDLDNIKIEDKKLIIGEINKILVETFNDDNNYIDVDSIEVKIINTSTGQKEVKILDTGKYNVEFFLPSSYTKNVTIEFTISKDDKTIMEQKTFNVQERTIITDITDNIETSLSESTEWYKENQGLAILIFSAFILVLIIITAVLKINRD